MRTDWTEAHHALSSCTRFNDFVIIRVLESDDDDNRLIILEQDDFRQSLPHYSKDFKWAYPSFPRYLPKQTLYRVPFSEHIVVDRAGWEVLNCKFFRKFFLHKIPRNFWYDTICKDKEIYTVTTSSSSPSALPPQRISSKYTNSKDVIELIDYKYSSLERAQQWLEHVTSALKEKDISPLRQRELQLYKYELLEKIETLKSSWWINTFCQSP